MTDESIGELLDRLSSPTSVDAAWVEFLDSHGPVVMRVVRRHFSDHEQAAEAFIHACGALSDDGFRRLRAFRPGGPAKFNTWLMAVASNLCIDWLRREKGRARPLRSIARLPELDQQVYRCIFERGMSRRECAETLAPRFPGLTESTVAGINARLFRLLTPQQRWHLTTRAPAPVGAGSAHASGDDDAVGRVACIEPGPEAAAADEEERQLLQGALVRLPADQRLLLRLRYEQGLTLADVARLTGQPDLFRANRQIQAALASLTELMAAPRAGRPDRKTP